MEVSRAFPASGSGVPRGGGGGEIVPGFVELVEVEVAPEPFLSGEFAIEPFFVPSFESGEIDVLVARDEDGSDVGVFAVVFLDLGESGVELREIGSLGSAGGEGVDLGGALLIREGVGGEGREEGLGAVEDAVGEIPRAVLGGEFIAVRLVRDREGEEELGEGRFVEIHVLGRLARFLYRRIHVAPKNEISRGRK